MSLSRTYRQISPVLLGWLFAAFLCVPNPLASAQAPQATSQVALPGAPNADGELRLTSSAPDHVAGQYTRDGVVVQFDSTFSGDGGVLKLTTATNTPLVTIVGDHTTYDAKILGEQLRLTGHHKEGEATDEPMVQGDKSAAQKLIETPEYKVLPYLSRALGAQGIGGKTHPASGAIHFIAMASARATGVKFAPGPEATAKQGAVKPGVTADQCFDQRGDPCQDNCFGMCGPNCTCWEWVCGSCCIWIKCLWHDIGCEEWNCKGSFKGFAVCFLAAPYVAQVPCDNVAAQNCVDKRMCNVPGTCTGQGGIISGNSCCPKSCGTCGGSGCGGRPGGAAACCTSNIEAANLPCSGNAPPCVINPLPADPQCHTGIISGNVCCEASCGTCGGSGCGSRPGGAASCCTSSIQSSGRSCKRYPPPCVID